MHIEPGIVDGTKIVLSYATAAASCGYAVKLAAETIREQGIGSFAPPSQNLPSNLRRKM